MNIMAKRKKTELASKKMIDITKAIGMPMESKSPYVITKSGVVNHKGYHPKDQVSGTRNIWK